MQQVGVDSNHLRAQPHCPYYLDELTSSEWGGMSQMCQTGTNVSAALKRGRQAINGRKRKSVAGGVLFIPWRVRAEEAGAAKSAIMAYGFGGAVADFVLVISGSRRRPRRSPVRGQLRHDPIATAG
jgi:hypothetical protein